jgi:hypothetical protein
VSQTVAGITDVADYGEFKVHPINNCFPLMPDDEFASLVADIAEQGLFMPITLTADGTTIVDGRLRYLACVGGWGKTALHQAAGEPYRGADPRIHHVREPLPPVAQPCNGLLEALAAMETKAQGDQLGGA